MGGDPAGRIFISYSRKDGAAFSRKLGRLASGSLDNTIRLWNVATGAETARLELDAPIRAIAAPAPKLIVAGDTLGRLHWLEVRD